MAAQEVVRPGARVLQVNVSRGGLPKLPVEGAARVQRSGIEGDRNRYRSERLDGDLEAAVLLLPLATIEAHARAGFQVGPGSMGENLTLEGVGERDLEVGQRWRIGSALLEVTRPCAPCAELRAYGDGLVRAALGRRGWYARVVEEGSVRAGDAAVRLADTTPRSCPSV